MRRGNEFGLYLIEGGPDNYVVADMVSGWIVYTGRGGRVGDGGDHFLVVEAAKYPYPSGAAALAAVLAALDASND